MQILISITGLQAYALVLAFLQSMSGVRTDEAKYLLNIPYPHPPAARFILGLTDGWIFQELFWRIVFATLLVQAVFLVWSMGKILSRRDRFVLCAVWLLSAALVTQAGSVMMASLTAVEGLVFTWLWVRRDIEVTRFAGWLALFWLLSLFTAFQAILFLPVVCAVFWRTKLPRWFRVLCIAAPVALLLLYVLGHPLLAASILLAKGDNGALSLVERLKGVFIVWGITGSVWAAILGIAGIVSKRTGALFWTLVLLSVYVMVSFHEYYAILFLPVFIAGLVPALRHWPLPPPVVLSPVILGTILLFPHLRPPPRPDSARAVSALIEARHQTGSLLIAGSFGHQWEYESHLEIRRYRPELLKNAQAVVCLQACEDMKKQKGWETMSGAMIEMWVRKRYNEAAVPMGTAAVFQHLRSNPLRRL